MGKEPKGMTTTETTRTSTKVFAVFDKDFTYEFYGTITRLIEAGSRVQLRGRACYIDAHGELIMTLGHGCDTCISRKFYHLEEEVTEIVEKKTTYTRRV